MEGIMKNKQIKKEQEVNVCKQCKHYGSGELGVLCYSCSRRVKTHDYFEPINKKE